MFNTRLVIGKSGKPTILWLNFSQISFLIAATDLFLFQGLIVYLYPKWITKHVIYDHVSQYSKCHYTINSDLRYKRLQKSLQTVVTLRYNTYSVQADKLHVEAIMYMK